MYTFQFRIERTHFNILKQSKTRRPEYEGSTYAVDILGSVLCPEVHPDVLVLPPGLHLVVELHPRVKLISSLKKIWYERDPFHGLIWWNSTGLF